MDPSEQKPEDASDVPATPPSPPSAAAQPPSEPHPVRTKKTVPDWVLIAGAFAQVATVGVLIWQTSLLSTSVDETRDSSAKNIKLMADSNRVSLEALELSRETLKVTSRAWLTITDATLEEFGDGRLIIKFRIYNDGASDARVASIAPTIYFGNVSRNLDTQITSFAPKVISPHRYFEYEMVTIKVGPVKEDSFRIDGYGLWLVVRVTYGDQFEAAYPTVTYRSIWDPSAKRFRSPRETEALGDGGDGAFVPE